MRAWSFTPPALVTLSAFLATQVLPFMAFGLRTGPLAALAVLILGSAFALLFAGHFLVRSSGPQWVLALASVPLLAAWLLAAAVMAFLAPGLAGAVTLGALLWVPVVLLIFVLRRR